jgi:D-alanyl-D-alanine carboxypeptidase
MAMRSFVLAAALITAGLPFGAGTQERGLPAETVAALDEAVDKAMKDGNLPGLAVGIWTPGEGDYVIARGKADLTSGLPRPVEAPYRVGSITKTAVGTVILKLVEAGQVSKTDTISKWYPDFPRANEITLDDLLRMRSGIPDSADTAFLKEYYAHPLIHLTAADMIQRSAQRPKEFKPPDQETVYTNVNFMILAEIAEKVGGAGISEQLEKYVFEPLGMTQTLYTSDDAMPGPLHGYSWEAAENKFRDMTVLNPAPAGGAGAIISTLADLRTWGKALCTGTLLSPDLQKARLEGQPLVGQPNFVQYGEAIVLIGEFCGHNGTIFGFSSEMWYLPAEDAVMVINVNRLDEDDESESTNLFLTLAKIAFPQHVDW